MSYGVLPTGFNRKPLAVTLQEIENQMVTEFGPQVVQTPQSPLGQINGLEASLIDKLWQLAEDAYQSYDPDQAEGTRLDILATLRILQRMGGESDTSLRQAITNQGRARIDLQDIARAIQSIDGVSYVQVFVNDSPVADQNNVPAGSVAAAVIGGDDEEVAACLRRYVVPGINTFGNVYVNTNIDGYCRTVAIIRPILVPVKLVITVRSRRDQYGCPPPALDVIRDGFVNDIRLINGEGLNHFKIRSVIESRYPNVEVLTFQAERDGNPLPEGIDLTIEFLEMVTLASDDVTVVEALT